MKAVLVSDYIESVPMLVRGPSLAASMSRYPIDELAGEANVAIQTDVEVVGVAGADTLHAIGVVAGRARRHEHRPSDERFVFIGRNAPKMRLEVVEGTATCRSSWR